MPLSETFAEPKSSLLGVEILDLGPDEIANIVIGIGNDLIVEFVVDFGEKDVGGIGLLAFHGGGWGISRVSVDRFVKITMLEEGGDPSAPYWVVVVTSEGREG
jgi:hypothetical protein